MKTAISIPNETFDAAEHFASTTGMSRSELYTKAVLEYLNKHKYLDITDALNKVYSETDSSLDSELHSMQVKALRKEDW
jgi:metal-responsive CopG/Arc/MetJ family transcriptional regulator